MAEKLTPAFEALVMAADQVRKAFGAPGDYGYESKEGRALFALYKASATIAPTERPAGGAGDADALSAAHAFCYALLGAATADEAREVWLSNPEARMRAHRAIYEHKPQAVAYEDMMRGAGRGHQIFPREGGGRG